MAWALLDLVLSTNAKQRVRITRSMLATFVYAVGWILCEFALRHWHVPEQGVRAYEWSSLLIAGAFYAVLRGGFNQRFADPSLTGAQIIAAQWLKEAPKAATQFAAVQRVVDGTASRLHA